jgi:putative cell wall-binding protein
VGSSVAPPPLVTTEIEGADRIGTAIEASKATFASGSGATAVIATAMNWPDALGGAALAGAVNGPILLTYKDTIPSAGLTELTRLGTTKVYLLGGTAAVGTAVENALKTKLGPTNVTRIDGVDRYETARKVAAEAVRVVKLSGTFDGMAFAATGANFPDALGASPISAANGWPIYLVKPTGIDSVTITAMKAAGVSDVVILGGTGVVSGPTQTTLDTQFGDVTRIGGVDRYDTARQVAVYGVGSAGMQWDGVAIATGANFPDALAGGPMQGASRSVMLLTRSDVLSPDARTALEANAAQIAEVRFLGGLAALSQTVRDAVVDALR